MGLLVSSWGIGCAKAGVFSGLYSRISTQWDWRYYSKPKPHICGNAPTGSDLFFETRSEWNSNLCLDNVKHADTTNVNHIWHYHFGRSPAAQKWTHSSHAVAGSCCWCCSSGAGRSWWDNECMKDAFRIETLEEMRHHGRQCHRLGGLQRPSLSLPSHNTSSPRMSVFLPYYYRCVPKFYHILTNLDLIKEIIPGPTKVYNDIAASCICWAQTMTTKGLRHIQIRENMVREAAQRGDITPVEHISGSTIPSSSFPFLV